MGKMSRIIHYLSITGLLTVGGVATYKAIKGREPINVYQSVTRNPVDSLTAVSYLKIEQILKQHREKAAFPWSEITTSIVALAVAGAGIGFKGFKREVYSRFKGIEEQLKTVADQRNRDSVDQRLTKIEHDAAGFADSEQVKALIEGIGGRTRSFCRDVMSTDFTEDTYEFAIMKINARVQDDKHQVKDLGFSDYFIEEMNRIRCEQLKQLKLDLGRLVQDRLHNSKYDRFSEIICRFQRNYMKAVIRLGHETNQA